MAIAKGTLSYLRFRTESAAHLSAEEIANKLNLFRFRPLHEKGEDIESVGWVPYGFEFENEKPIEYGDFAFDKNIILSMRSDKIKIPSNMLKALVKKSIRDYENEFKKSADRVVKKEIELAEKSQLRSKILPNVKLIEAQWSPEKNEMRVLNRSQTVLDQFLDLFEETFLLRPRRLDFALVSAEKCLPDNISRLETLSAKPIFNPPLRTEVN